MTIPLCAACTTAGPAPTAVDTGCDWTRPIYVSAEDQLTPSTARQVLRHNETRAAICAPTNKPTKQR